MSFPTLNIGDLIAKTPIVQGGMGVGISLSRLASAVANEGGIGVIAGAMIGMKEPDVASNPLEANLRALRRHSTQTRRSANERFTNISGSFAVVNPRELDGLNVVIVDDVITTGSTMADCIRAVGESSAPASINVLSLGATLLKA